MSKRGEGGQVCTRIPAVWNPLFHGGGHSSWSMVNLRKRVLLFPRKEGGAMLGGVGKRGHQREGYGLLPS